MQQRAAVAGLLVALAALGLAACRRPLVTGPDRVSGPSQPDARLASVTPATLSGQPPTGYSGPVDLNTAGSVALPAGQPWPSTPASGAGQAATSASPTAGPSSGASQPAPAGAAPSEAGTSGPTQGPVTVLPPPPPQPKRNYERAASNVTTAGGVISSPAEGAAIASGPLQIRLGASESPQYLAQIDAHITRLIKAGEEAKVEGLKPGPHVLRVIPCNAQGVVDLNAAQSVRTFTIGPQPLTVPGFNASGPILNIGRPFGTVKPDEIGAVLMDVRVDGVKLSEAGTLLKYKIDNAPDSDAAVVSDYPPKRPVQLFDLGRGKHTLTAWLELDGQRLENGGVARVEREFNVAP